MKSESVLIFWKFRNFDRRFLKTWFDVDSSLLFSRAQFANSLYNFYKATRTTKGTLLLNNSIVKRSVEKKTKSRFSQNLDGFCDNIESWY